MQADTLYQQLEAERARRQSADATLHQARAALTARGFAGRVALHDAVARGDVSTVRNILAVAPKSAAFRNEHGETAFHLAAGQGSVKNLQLLLEAAPDVLLALDSKGKTTLHAAASCPFSGREPVLRWLLQAAPQLAAAKDNLGWPAMHSAATNSRKGASVVRLLAAASPQLVQDSSERHTPLHVAAWIAAAALLLSGCLLMQRARQRGSLGFKIPGDTAAAAGS
ncbi:hypothetical protein ABPG75_002740 [Micractinium tetrahymenae]